jgi:predicted RNase H-like HicB family nuclease
MSELSGSTTPESRYELVVYWSDEDGAFVAEVPDLPGCMADGPTHAAAAQAAERVIREWIETARELGRPIPEPRSSSRAGR